MDAGSHDQGASTPPELLPKHTIFLSHSGEEKAFVQELNQALRLVNHSPFFDQNEDSLPIGERFPDLIFKAAEQCRVAVIILSPGYLTSKWPMLELVAFHKSKMKGNKITLLPVFYKLTPDHIEKPEWTEAWVDLFKQDEELVRKCKDAVHTLKAIHGLIFERYGNDHVKYKKDVVLKICKLWPPPKLFDTSDMQGCDRLCKLMSELFKEHNGIHYLGIYGIRGSGKSKQCQAMYNYYFEKYAGKFCILDLEDDETTENRAKKKRREERLKIVIEQLVGSNQIMSDTNSEEAQLRRYLKDRMPNEHVFLVVENVSQSSIKEAEFYVKVGYAHGSRVLVTSRNRSFLEKVFGGRQYSDFCQSVPVLNDTEAAQLVLAKGASGRLISDLKDLEYKIVNDCCAKSCYDEQYHPSTLIALASYLSSHEIATWKELFVSFEMSKEASDLYRHVLLEYDSNLSRISKLIFMDLALFNVCKLTRYIDLYPSWQWLEWLECLKYKIAIDNISCVHDLSFEQAQTKVKELQEMSFLKESTTEVAVPDFYREFARRLMKDVDRDEMKWYYWYESEQAKVTRFRWCVPDKWPETGTRVIMFDVSLYYDEHLHFQAFTKLVYLELERVEKVQKLNLQGLSSLRVMKVKQCKDLKEIVCRCSLLWLFPCYISIITDNRSCLGELRYVELIDLPNLKSVSFAPHSNLESLWIYDCPMISNVWCLWWTLKTLKRLALPSGLSISDTMLKKLMGDQALNVVLMGLTTLVIQRGHDQVVIEEEIAKYFLKTMEDCKNLRMLDIGDVIPASIGSIESINVSKLVHLIILDLSGAKMTRIEELCKLQNLHALSLYGCSELLTLPNLDIFTELRKLCISHCYKLAKNFSKEAVQPHGVGNFHALGDKCNFDDHECLNPGWERESSGKNVVYGKG